MRIINTAKDNPAILDSMGRLAFYSGMDNLTLFEIRDGLSELMDKGRWKTYDFEMEMQAPLLEMSFNGCHVDQPVRNELKSEFSGIVRNLTDFLNEMLEALGYFQYYTRMGVHEFSVVSGLPLDSLPRSWDEWKDRPVQWRREVKLIAGELNLKTYHKVLKAGDAPFNPNSPAQKLRLFYHFFGIETNSIAEPYFYKPPWLKTHGIKEYKSRKTDGTYGPSTDRAAMEKIIGNFGNEKSAAHFATPFAKVCLDIADLTKSLGFLNCRLEDGMFRASFGAVTETGRLSSRANAMGYGSNAQNVTPKLRHIFTVPQGWKLSAPDYGQIESRIVAAVCYRLFGLKNYIAATECLTADHEVLTPDGWVSINNKPAILATWEVHTNQIRFEPVLKWTEQTVARTYEINTKTYSIRTTAKHKMLYYSNRDLNKPRVRYMENFFRQKSAYAPTGGEYHIGNIAAKIELQLLAAYQADGYLNQRGIIEFSFSKQEKIKRLTKLLNSLGVIYSTNIFPPYSNQTLPTTRFYIKRKAWPTSVIKIADKYLLKYSYESLLAYTKEHEYWDGYSDTLTSFRLTNKSIKHLKWVATIAHLVGMTASKPSPDHDSWRISIRNKNITDIGAAYGTRKIIDEEQQTYCPTTSTGYFLYRRNGHIAVSGNSGDLHTLASSMVWDNLPWPEDFTVPWTIKHGPFPLDMIKAAKKIASKEFYRGKSRRDVSKTLGHGTSYMGKPPQMSKHSHIEVKLIEHYQEVFFDGFPEMAMWHAWVAEQVQTEGQITTMLGRTRRFFGRPNDDATLREAVAYEPQSVAADYTNAALLRMLKAYMYGVRDESVREALIPEALSIFESKFPDSLPIKIFLQKHDELGYRYEQHHEEDVNLIVTSLMEKHIPLTSPEGIVRDWFVPVEMESGWNLGFRKKAYTDDKGVYHPEENPNGVGHPDSTLIRQQPKPWTEWKL